MTVGCITHRHARMMLQTHLVLNSLAPKSDQDVNNVGKTPASEYLEAKQLTS